MDELLKKPAIKPNTIIEPQPDAAMLDEREKKWRVTLPPLYRDFLMAFNGGVPVCSDFLCGTKTYHIEYFFCVSKPLLWDDISVAETQYGERLTANEDLVGVELLPIARLTGDDLVCLDFRKPKTEPSVCVWSNDESGEFDPVTYEAAKSFEDFILRLHLPLTIKDNIVSIKGCRDVESTK